MKFFALYLSSRGTTVNRISIDGLLSAKLPARRATANAATVRNTGHVPSAANPTMLTNGRNASDAARPSHRISRPVRNTCVTSVSDCTTSSMRASTAVRAARSA